MDHVMVMQNIITTFLVFLSIFLAIYLISRRPGKRKGREIYACGEDISPERLNVPQDSFFRVFTKALGIEWLRRMHTGNVSDYLIWIVLGLIFIILVLSTVW
jgi:hypothetical protein